ncbi:peptidylprolyl isomerase [Allorhodopirellula solitaria]|uniref:peptidylprolyl isomerase n=1 Tax=Allorhodopirellula solitaria TaxID=2527987 RepID=A0A5C5X130_9BACT|nr:peptidylprolyl isomerase [Allorhodopirellula solitaria]TWT55922.1 putative bifunctional phosphatase/peptidyl-prolyl cis-trans isomerase [Allorhodopirellula solitaria]
MPVFTPSFEQNSAAAEAENPRAFCIGPRIATWGGWIICMVLALGPASAQEAATAPEAAEMDSASSAAETPVDAAGPETTPETADTDQSAPSEAPNAHNHDSHDHGSHTHESQSQDEGTAPSELVRDDPRKIQEALEALPDDVRADAEVALERYRESETTLAAATLALRSDQLRYRNGIDQSPDAADRFRLQRHRTWELLKEQFTNALDLIRYVPSIEAARYLVTMVQYHLKHDIYDAETYEAAARLLDLGQNYEFLFLAAGRSAVVAGQFEAAKNIYEVLDNEGLEDVDLRLKHQLDILEEQYEEEQAAIESTDADTLPQVRFETTQGDVLIELFPDAAPSAVAHFRKLIEDGFYEGLDFSMVSQNLLAMTGDSSGDGRGNSGQFLVDEHGRDESRHGLRGSVVMAKLPIGEGKFIENSGSSQIAILFLPIPAISDSQSVIGRVIQGMDVVSKLRRIDPTKKKEKNQIQLPPDAVLRTEIVRSGPELPEPGYVDLEAEIEKAVQAGLLKPKGAAGSPAQ